MLQNSKYYFNFPSHIFTWRWLTYQLCVHVCCTDNVKNMVIAINVKFLNEITVNMPVRKSVWAFPQATRTMLRPDKPSIRVGTSRRTVSPWPSWAFSLRPTQHHTLVYQKQSHTVTRVDFTYVVQLLSVWPTMLFLCIVLLSALRVLCTALQWLASDLFVPAHLSFDYTLAPSTISNPSVFGWRRFRLQTTLLFVYSPMDV